MVEHFKTLATQLSRAITLVTKQILNFLSATEQNVLYTCSPKNTKKYITCKVCQFRYAYFADQVDGTPEKCRDCKRKAFLEVLQKAKKV